jgi:prepilin-type N-terminal cleavage/methylation domain-containing protein
MEAIAKSMDKGFSIIESLVAILILSIALVPLLYISTSSNTISANIRNNLIAANLVQEGLEVVRSIRDASWHSGDPAFNTDLPDGVYRVQWDSTSVIPLGLNPPLKIDGNGVYNYSVGTDTNFSRTITITQINPNEIRVVTEVSWPVKGNVVVVGCNAGTRCISAESHLYDWK